MIVTKPLDLARLRDELNRGGIPVVSLGTSEVSADPYEAELFTHDEVGMPLELPPEAAPIVEAHDPTVKARTATFEEQEDAERLALVAERSATDPAFAALAELTLNKQGA